MIPKLWILKASARLETDLYIGCSRVIVQPISKANYQDTVVHSMGLSSLALNVSGLPVNSSWLFISITGLQACAYEAHVQELMFDSKPWETDTRLGLRGHPTQSHDASSSTIPTREAHRMSPPAHLASCPLHGGTNTAPACVLHCLLSRWTFHIIAIHCLMLRPYPWAPNTYLSSGFLTGEGKDESSVPKTTVSLKHAMPKLGSSVLVASLRLQKPVTSCLILWAKHTALSSNGSGSLRAFLRIDRRFLTSLCQKASVCAA